MAHLWELIPFGEIGWRKDLLSSHRRRTDTIYTSQVGSRIAVPFLVRSQMKLYFLSCLALIFNIHLIGACPWAHRTMITRAIKGLEDVISFTVVMPIWQRTKPDDPTDAHCGWMFSNPGGTPIRNAIGLGGPFPSSDPRNEPDPHFGARSVRELYKSVGQIGGTFTVPILFDKKLKTIVSNESSEIIQMLDSEFNDLAGSPEIDLQPDSLKSVMEEVDEWVYSTINNGVYRSVDRVFCGKYCICNPNNADFAPPSYMTGQMWLRKVSGGLRQGHWRINCIVWSAWGDIVESPLHCWRPLHPFGHQAICDITSLRRSLHSLF